LRYQSPVTSPLAHYWEEEVAGFWSFWLRFRIGWQKSLNLFFGEFVFAHIYLLIDLVSGSTIPGSIRTFLANLVIRIRGTDSLKRTVDISGALVGLLLGLPVWAAVALLVKLDSKGPIFYTQLRVGRNRRRADRRRLIIDLFEQKRAGDRRKEIGFGKPFRIIKFRTMRVDAEKECGPVWASRHDPRITRVGRILRATRIDEIPQLLNVLIGDMSLVGPRPERPYFVARLNGVVNDYYKRFDVKPGVTGLAQVEHKYDESIEDVGGKIKYDLNYIRNFSLIQDIKILMKTVIVVITARGM
jgi:lipopolysaccharide/colanic/teichoic acid biosynthesis glycosyltransferase